MNRVFVSYSRKNKTFAERLARDLSDAGLDVWVDWRQIQGGELWQQEIYKGIDRSEILVFCLSPDSIVSEWCQREVLTAREKGRYIVPVMAVSALDILKQTSALSWLADVHFINFADGYEAAFPELLDALPGMRRVGVYDDTDVANIPNPFKGLEAFQQTDAQFFFGREELIAKSLKILGQDRQTRFLAVVGASGSGKSSLVRAGVIPAVRAGQLPGSDTWRVAIFAPGATPTEALATRLLPLLPTENPTENLLAVVTQRLHQSPDNFDGVTAAILKDAPPEARLLIVVDQFEEVFTRASEDERDAFLKLLYRAVTAQGGKTQVIITMRADFFGRLSAYPNLAELFEQENMVIATEMTPANLLRSIEGPAQAVGLVYDPGLTERILDDVRRQPGSLPLLEYALKELYERREGRRLTTAAYEAIGGVQRALAQHAEDIYSRLTPMQQALMRRVLLQLVDVGENGTATRRRVNRADLVFRGTDDSAVQEVIDLLTAAESRLLIASREIISSTDEHSQPVNWLEVSHEALINEWDRFKGWVAESAEDLRFGSELLAAAHDWDRGGRDVAYLLTGKRLARAEIWLETADASPIQRDFVQASLAENQRRTALEKEQQARELALQQQSARRLRYFVAVLAVSLVIAAGLTLFALSSLDRANQSAEREKQAANDSATAAAVSKRSAEEARSLALSSSAAQSFSDQNVEQALALVVQANQIPDPPPQAQKSLADIAYASGLRRVFEGHTAAVNSVALSADGTLALSGSVDQNMIVWDVAGGNLLHRLSGHTGSVTSVAFSPDRQFALSGSLDQTAILWNVATGEQVRRMEDPPDAVLSIAFSPDGKTALAGLRDNTLVLWDVGTGKMLHRFGQTDGHTGAVNSVAMSPDGKTALSGGADSAVILWNLAAQSEADEILHRFTGHQASVNSVAYSPDAHTGASGSADDTIFLWNLDVKAYSQGPQAESIAQLTGHSDAVTSVAFSSDGKKLVSGSEDSTIILWDMSSHQPSQRFNARDAVQSVAFSADGHLVLSAVGTRVLLWDTQRAEIIRTFEGHDSRVESVAYSPDGKLALSASANRTGRVGDLRLWDLDTGRSVQQFVGHTAAATGAVFSPDGKTILSGSQDNTLILWDVASGKPIRSFGGHTDIIYAVALSPDGKTALSASKDKTLILWDVASGKPIRTFSGHTGAVFAVAFSPDGKTAVSGAADNSMIVWEVGTGAMVRQITGNIRAVRSVAFSPDGTLIASGASDGSVIVWRASDGQIERRFAGTNTRVNAVIFSPDGRFVLSGAEGGTIQLWDVQSGFELRRYTAETGGVTSLAFSADGRTILSGLTNNTLRLWRMLPDTRDLLDWTFSNRFVGELDCDTRQQFQIEPACQNGAAPTSTPYPLPTPTLTPSDVRRLTLGAQATVNTTNGDKLNLRGDAGTSAPIIMGLPDGAVVTLLDGPRQADGLVWWRVRTANNVEGWAAESQASEQTLVP
jgi:WD40 repeat protein